jgi:hypothetical protein
MITTSSGLMCQQPDRSCPLPESAGEVHASEEEENSLLIVSHFILTHIKGSPICYILYQFVNRVELESCE